MAELFLGSHYSRERFMAKPQQIKATLDNRPEFPKKAVVTAGMPYGNKELHFGHIGGVFIYADIYTRFLRDRIGQNNVMFVSGTDGYGSPIVESYEKLVASNQFSGSIEDFVAENHKRQKEMLDAYQISIEYAASSFGNSAKIHQQISAELFKKLHSLGHLKKITTQQFYDGEKETFLNGRQVVGRCPILNCPSEKAYADECSLGHQYMPHELEHPKSTVTGKAPEMREVTNWFLDLVKFRDHLYKWSESLHNGTKSRMYYVKTIREFLEPPIIHIKRDLLEDLEAIEGKLPSYQLHDTQAKSVRLEFDSLNEREQACAILTQNSIRYRTGKTLVPFRLTGNIEWGLPIPALEGLDKLTWWCWPESLIAPISFTAAALEQQGKPIEAWRDWWHDADSNIYQFIGEDNVYFYGIAQPAMFMGLQANDLDKVSIKPATGEMQTSQLVVNNHLLFLNTKASSSSKVKPPLARELLDFYTSDQLRTHFFSLGLGIRSVGFKPKPFNPKATEKEGDPVLKEGNLLCNVFNRSIRSCFYTAQKYFENKAPYGELTQPVREAAQDVILTFERLMFDQEFHLAIALVDKYIRSISKYWTHHSREADKSDNQDLRQQTLIDTFHMVRVATVLMHPIAPEGTEKVREYLQLGDEFWSWDQIFEPIYTFMKDPQNHELKFLEPRVDFFAKHPSQLPPQ